MTITIAISAHFDDEVSELNFIQAVAGVVRRGGVESASAATSGELGHVDLLNDPRAVPGSLDADAAAAGRGIEPETEPDAVNDGTGTTGLGEDTAGLGSATATASPGDEA